MSLEFSGFSNIGLSPLNCVSTFPFISSDKVQVNSGLSLKLIFTPIGHVKSLSFNFMLLIEVILEVVVPVISEVNFIFTSLPMIDTKLIVICQDYLRL